MLGVGVWPGRRPLVWRFGSAVVGVPARGRGKLVSLVPLLRPAFCVRGGTFEAGPWLQQAARPPASTGGRGILFLAPSSRIKGRAGEVRDVQEDEHPHEALLSEHSGDFRRCALVGQARTTKKNDVDFAIQQALGKRKYFCERAVVSVAAACVRLCDWAHCRSLA